MSEKKSSDSIGIFRARTTEREEFFLLARDMCDALKRAEAWRDSSRSDLVGYVDLVEWVTDPVNEEEVAWKVDR